jgi:hypothetical protein
MQNTYQPCKKQFLRVKLYLVQLVSPLVHKLVQLLKE